MRRFHVHRMCASFLTQWFGPRNALRTGGDASATRERLKGCEARSGDGPHSPRDDPRPHAGCLRVLELVNKLLELVDELPELAVDAGESDGLHAQVARAGAQGNVMVEAGAAGRFCAEKRTSPWARREFQCTIVR